MTRRANADLTQLREQMTALTPGVVTNAAETAAPILAKIIGYAELASAFLPPIRQALEGGTVNRAARGLPLQAVPKQLLPTSLRRTRSWRMRGLVVALPICAGLAAYAAWRFRPATAKRRRASPG